MRPARIAPRETCSCVDRLDSRRGSAMATSGGSKSGLGAAVRLARTLDQGVLGIQGPPGTGKTWTGARMALELIRQGKRVGVTAQSHKAISNFLRAIDAAVAEGDARPIIAQACDNGDDATDLGDHVWLEDDPRRQRRKVHELMAGRRRSPPGRRGSSHDPPWPMRVDALFVDEAGQMSLANVMAMSGGHDIDRHARRPRTSSAGDTGSPSLRRRRLGARPSHRQRT